MVGYRDDDHRWLWGHGSQDLPGNVRRSSLRVGWCADHRSARACHSVQLLYVLFTYSGK